MSSGGAGSGLAYGVPGAWGWPVASCPFRLGLAPEGTWWGSLFAWSPGAAAERMGRRGRGCPVPPGEAAAGPPRGYVTCRPLLQGPLPSLVSSVAASAIGWGVGWGLAPASTADHTCLECADVSLGAPAGPQTLLGIWTGEWAPAPNPLPGLRGKLRLPRGSRAGPSKSPALGGDALGATRAQEGPCPWPRLGHLFPLSIAPCPAPSLHWALRHPLPSARPGAGGRVWAQCGGAQCFPRGPSGWWKQGSPTPSSCYSRRDRAGKDTLPREAGCLTWETDGRIGPAPGWGWGKRGSPVTAGRWGEEGKAGPGG